MNSAMVILALALGGLVIIASLVELSHIRKRNMANSLAAVADQMQNE